jgi:prepilin-type N-terminal cleavage/methylation domain-containing protein
MKKRTQLAFTLMELMVVLAIAGVLLTLTVPNIQKFIKNNKMTAVANDMITALALARNESIKLQQPVALCASADAKTANPTCTVGTFSSGWVVFVDVNNNGLHDNGERVVSAHEALDPQISSGGNNSYLVSYAATGFTQTSPGGRVTTTQMAICDDRHNTATLGTLSAARAVTINPTGRARVTRDITEIQNVISAIGSFGNCT